jgi:16S rRNA (guanine966-N2)-methyltransferase
MRIIAGRHRGRRLLPPKGRTTRPILHRVKMSLFNILAPEVEGAVVVDLFAGTGTLGLEAISRGAELCCFAERDRSALERLRRNVETVGEQETCRIWRGDVLRRLPAWLAELARPVDLGFIDPPFAMVTDWVPAAAGRDLFAPLAVAAAPDATFVFRCERNIDPTAAFGPLSVRSRRDYGRVSLWFLIAEGGTATGQEGKRAEATDT